MKGKDFLTLGDLSPDDLTLLLNLSERLKKRRVAGLGSRALRGKTVALVFEKPSTRTRVSFQVAISELGGSTISLGSNELQLGRGETIEDTAHVLSRYVHAVMARVNRHSDLERLAASSTVPVINGLSERHHPVQILADLLALREHKGRLKGLRVAWVGDGNNVCNSWLQGAALAGIELAAATPRGHEPSQDILKGATELSKTTGARLRITDDPDEAVKNADCVMTDTFVSMGFDQEREQRLKDFLPRYQVNHRLMSLAKQDAVFEHCLPAHRGEEVTSNVIDGPNSIVFDEAENRLHTEKALLCFLMLGRKDLSSLLRGR